MMQFLVQPRPVYLVLLTAFSSLSCLAKDDAIETPGAPVIHVSAPTLEPTTSIEINFPTDMVYPESVGTSMDNYFLSITPVWEGRLVWKSPRTARFEPAETPPLATSFTLHIPPYLVSLTGEKLAGSEVVTLTSPGLAMTSQQYRYRYYGKFHEARDRLPKVDVSFEDAIDLDSLNARAYFKNEDGVLVPAAITRESSLSARSWDRRWRERIHARLKSITPAEGASYRIQPRHRLPLGEVWKLHIDPGVWSADAKQETSEPYEIRVGSVRPFVVESFTASNPYDEAKAVRVHFSKPLHPDLARSDLRPWIAVKPDVNISAVRVQSMDLRIEGDFAFGRTYRITVHPGLLAEEASSLREPALGTVHFEPNDPAIALPTTDEVQLRYGKLRYPILAMNLAEVRVRVKGLRGREVLLARSGYDSYEDGRGKEGGGVLPFGLIAGESLLDKRFESTVKIDRTENIHLDWKPWLEDSSIAALFLHVEATPKPETGDGKPIVSQALIQLTDLGALWKRNDEELFLHVFSYDTGYPVPGAAVRLVGDRGLLAQGTTDESGVCRLPNAGEALHLEVASEGDRHVLSLRDMGDFDTWQFWRLWNEGDEQGHRSGLLFTDRQLYRPGETVHLKALLRRIDGPRIDTSEETKGTLVCLDSRDREISRQDVSFSRHGSFSHVFDLPEETVGRFRLQLALEELREGDRVMPAMTLTHGFNVQEFRRNAFEILMEPPAETVGAAEIHVPIRARYFMGTPLGKTACRWHAEFHQTGFYPDRYGDYLFGDHREEDPFYWRSYYGYRWQYYHGYGESEASHGELTLDDDGAAVASLSVPRLGDFPSPENVVVSVEITDKSQQTLNASVRSTWHPADFYLGIERQDQIIRENTWREIGLLAVGTDGSPWEKAVPANLRLEKRHWETVKVELAGGGITHRNESRLELLEERDVLVEGAQARFPIRFPSSGDYLVTVESADDAGRLVKTAQAVDVYGESDYAWQGVDGIRIELLPDKASYEPGDTAKVLIKTPIEGPALVTVEREKVLRSFTTELRGTSPVVDVPLLKDDGPNVFVSVTVLNGASRSPYQTRRPEVKVGYAELRVTNRRDALQVAVASELSTVRPGSEVRLEVQVTDAVGEPVGDCEVTLYAVDEGALSVAGYENPDPLNHFHRPRPLGVRSGSSIEGVMSEAEFRGWYGNKGFVMGDGGAIDSLARQDFRACAFWAADLLTDDDGRVRASFAAPDSLTRYRVIAVAADTGRRFGAGTAAFEVNKPLMLQPVVPRHANVGDRLNVKALVHNRSEHAGRFRIALKVNDRAAITAEAAADTPPSEDAREIDLEAGASATIPFPVTFVEPGEAVWRWEATPVSPLSDESNDLEDVVESRFPVSHPIPPLHGRVRARVTADQPVDDVLGRVEPSLLQGRGEVAVLISNSRLVDAAGAIEYMLAYPYGCVEQTTSSMMPWFTVLAMEKARFAMDRSEETMRHALAQGVARLVSMQTREGGLGYWPGARETSLWGSAYGGMALAMAKEMDIYVSDEVLAGVCDYLSAQLRDLHRREDSTQLATLSLALHTLAMAGRPEPAYHELLYQRRRSLPAESQYLLAATIRRTSSDDTAGGMVRALLRDAENTEAKTDYWFHKCYADALALMAWSECDPRSPQTNRFLEKLLQGRDGSGHWRSTFTNAWALRALVSYARHVESGTGEAELAVIWAGEEHRLELTADRSHAEIDLPLAPERAEQPLNVRLRRGSGVYLDVNVTSRGDTMPRLRSDRGFAVSRSYERLTSEGKREPLTNAKVGDTVLVGLDVRYDGRAHYVVVDDPLPSVLEPIHVNFASQGGDRARSTVRSAWQTSHRELRDDRALFFCDYLSGSDAFRIEYLARVTSEGEAIAPPAKVEAMYEPSRYGLSDHAILRVGMDQEQDRR